MKLLSDKFLLNRQGFNTQILSYQKTDPHSHDFYEITYVVYGAAKHFVNGKETRLNISDLVILCPQKHTHYFTNIKGQEFIHRDILVGKKLFEDACNFLSPDLLKTINESDAPTVVNLSANELQFLENELKENFFDATESNAYLPYFLSILTVILGIVSKAAYKPQQKNMIWVSQLINFLSTIVNFDKTIPELLKEHFPYDQSYMCKAFKKTTGMTMSQYFNRAKLNYAKTLICSTDLSINVIAEKTGFNNLSHFNHEFKKLFFYPPSYFRKK